MGIEVQKLTQEVARLRLAKWLETESVTPADSADEVLTISEEIRKVGTPLSEESPASDQFGSITLMDGNVIPYLLVYKSTFCDQKISPKNRPRLIHESYTKT